MISAEDIKQTVKDIQTHYNSHINNKYVKKILLRVEIPIGTAQRMDYLLKGDLYYIDSRGAIEDLYIGIMASLEYIDIIDNEVVPRLAMTNADFVPSNPNERVLCQMTIKNYPTNIELFRKKIKDFFKQLFDYDNQIFPNDSAHGRLSDFEKLQAMCE